MITPERCRGARAILDWTRSDLSQASKVKEGTIKAFETGISSPTTDTIGALLNAFEISGIVFTEDGLKQIKTARIELTGDNWYLDGLDDVYQSLKANPGEFLLMYADDALSPPEVNDKIREIRSLDGVSMRQLIEEGNRYLLGETSEYRYVSKEHFQNNVILLYADKVLLCVSGNDEGLILKEPDLNETLKGTFDNLWNIGNEPEGTDAKERF